MLDLDNQISDNLYEVRLHGSLDFPFSIYINQFSENNLHFINYHWHPEIEIVYVKTGKLNYYVGEKEYVLEANQAMLVMPNQLHGAKYITNATWYAMLINPRLIYQTPNSIIFDKYFKEPKVLNLALDKNEIEIVLDMIKSYYNFDDFLELEIVSKLYELWLSINKRPIPNTSISKVSSYRLKLILDYINHNYNKKIKIEDISKEVNLCRSEICKLFKVTFNTTFTEYLIKFRLEKSIDLLLSNKTNITEISNLVGFNSSAYFTDTFKKYFNITPLAYRKKHTAKKN